VPKRLAVQLRRHSPISIGCGLKPKEENPKMIIKDPNKYGVIDLDRLKALEKFIGAPLPNEYRHFLIENNGGYPCPNYFSFADNMTRVHGSLYGLSHGPDSIQLDKVNNSKKGVVKYLIIGSDPFGNKIAIGLREINRGAVFFIDHEKSIHIENEPEKIADSFDHWLNSLHDWVNPVDTEVEAIIKSKNTKALSRLLESGFNIEKKVGSGKTLLELAAIHNATEIISLLHKNGATLNNALQFAERNSKYFPEYLESVTLLKNLYPS
jgi:hypothetical protein